MPYVDSGGINKLIIIKSIVFVCLFYFLNYKIILCKWVFINLIIPYISSSNGYRFKRLTNAELLPL